VIDIGFNPFLGNVPLGNFFTLLIPLKRGFFRRKARKEDFLKKGFL